MRSWLALMILVAGCQRRPVVDDCKIVLGDPANAVAEIGKRYPEDPVKRALVIEGCLAPDGEECDRLARIFHAIPAMMPAATGPAAARSEADDRTVCLDMPAEMRRCMRTSYVLGHQAECQRIVEGIKAAAVAPQKLPRRSEPCNGGRIVGYLAPAGAWLATGPDARCFAARRGGALDTAWLEGELRQFTRRACPPSVELAGAAGVRYQDLIAAMDAAIKVGLVDVGLSAPADSPVSFAAADARRAPPHCPATTLARGSAASPPAPPRPRPDPTRPLARLRDPIPRSPPPPRVNAATPVLILTRAELIVAGAAVATVAELMRGGGVIAPLDQALPHAPADPTIVLQADESSDMAVITRVVETANQAGYTNLLFAVKNK